MEYPPIVVISGLDIDDVEIKLKSANIKYKIINTDNKNDTKLHIKSTFYKNKDFFYLKDLEEGFKLPFFNSENVKLSWDVRKYMPKHFMPGMPKYSLNNDVALWNSKDSDIAITDAEKLILTNTIDKCLALEIETLNIYNDIMIPIFYHPMLINLFTCYSFQKENHVQLWRIIKYNLKLKKLINLAPFTKKVPLELDQLVYNLTTLVANAKILKPSTSACLTHFTNKGHLKEFVKFVERRDEENCREGKSIEDLLVALEKMYPFLTETIKFCTESANDYANQQNKNLQSI